MKGAFGRESGSSPSFALISVLALVALAALTATAFLASARLERAATRSIGSQTQLDMALQAGAEMARFMIDSTFQDPFLPPIVTCFRANPTNDLGYLILGKPTNTNTAAPVVRFYPMFSHARLTNLSLDGANPFSMTNALVSHQGLYSSVIANNMGSWTSGFGSAALTTNYVRFPLLSATNNTVVNDQDWSPAVGWITLSAKLHPTNTTNTPYARVAFFVQDMSGLIDADRMGGLTNRLTGTNPSEISLTNALGTSLVSPAVVSSLTNPNNRKFFLSAGLLRQSANLTNSDLRYVASGLRSSLVWSNQIPFGIAVTATRGYALAGSNRLALNPLPTLAALVTNLSTNLPDFATRAGGFTNSLGGAATNSAAYTSEAYLQTLAANIIDYADADSTPTTDGTPLSNNLSRPVYRGVDSYPLVNEINKRYQLISNVLATEAGVSGRMAVVATTDFIELWNPSSQTVSPGTLTFLILHGQSNNLGFLPSSFANPTRASNSLGPVSNGVSSNTFTGVTLPPNGFLTLACPTVTNYFFSPSTNPANFSFLLETNLSRYWVAWNGVYYDAALGGIYRNAGNLPNTSTIVNRGNLPSFIYRRPAGFADPAVGDPRATLYLPQILDANVFVGNSTFGGRNVRQGSVSSNQPYYEVAPRSWPDGGHNSPAGLSAGNDSVSPTSLTPATYTNIPPARISNAGSFSNLCELGAIFDPMQWGDPGLGSWQGKYTNLSSAGVATNAFGGGNSFRIGRAEHAKFAFTNFGGAGSLPSPNMGVAAASLLDIFSLSNAPVDHGGKINLNTAPGPVLRALAGGIYLRSDPGLLPGSNNFAVSAAMAEAFAQGVMRFRAQYPFYSPSQLGFIGTDSNWPNTTTWPSNAVFGNTNRISLQTNAFNSLTNTSLGVTAWNDQAAEEWFAKIFGLATTTSFNFRVYVMAQLLNAKGEPTSAPERRIFQIYCDYNSGGTNSTKQVGEFLY